MHRLKFGVPLLPLVCNYRSDKKGIHISFFFCLPLLFFSNSSTVLLCYSHIYVRLYILHYFGIFTTKIRGWVKRKKIITISRLVAQLTYSIMSVLSGNIQTSAVFHR